MVAVVQYKYSDKPVMPAIYYDNNHFIYTFKNQKSFREFTAFVDFNLEIIKDQLFIYWTNSVANQNSQGLNYNHKRTFFLIGANIEYRYKNWDLQIAAYSRYRSLWAESISIEPHDQTISLGYKFKQFYWNAGVNNPFQKKWSSDWESLSELNSTKGWTYIGSGAPLFYLNFSWNISWGKKYESRRKLLNNSQDMDAEILNTKDK